MNLLKRIFVSLGYALISIGVIYMMIPIIPTSLLIKPIDLEVQNSKAVIYTRSVLLPVEGSYIVEVERNQFILYQCNMSGKTWFEYRDGKPVIFELPCDITKQGDYKVEICVRAIGPFNLKFKSSCVSQEFRVGSDLSPVVDKRIDQLEDQINEVQRMVMP